MVSQPKPISPAQVVAAALLVAGVLALFHGFGPDPQAAADAALARKVAKSTHRGLVTDGAGLCPQTRAAALAKRVKPTDKTGAKAPNQLQSQPQSWRCVELDGRLLLQLTDPKKTDEKLPSVKIPGAQSLVGPLAAVALVLTLRHAALGLFLAVVLGAVASFGPLQGVKIAAIDVFWPTLTDGDNLLILAFTGTMLGMVHVAMATGGFGDLAWRIAKRAGGDPAGARRRTRLAAWLLGLAIFFDDYANSLVVGSSVRPLADKTGVSRAKLAYLVDATSAAVAGIAIVSTWVGFEVGLLDDQIARFSGIADAGYGVFLAAIPFRFYCILTVFFAGVIAWTGRDYGPMKAEQARAQATTEELTAPTGRAHWLDAMGPVLVVLLTVIGLDLWYGRANPGDLLTRFIAGADAAGLKVLAIAGVAGSVAAMGGAIVRGLLTPTAALGAWLAGIRAMAPVLAILVCAMAMRVVCDQAGTPSYLAALLGGVTGPWVPLLSFFVAALVAFMTGSSWATMGILLPIVVPLAATDPGPAAVWLLASTAAVLDGAIFGDHCSPISDTTVMSSAASGCPHDVHVWTQLPYALTVMAAAAIFGYVGTAHAGLSAWAALGLAAVTLVIFVTMVGRHAQPTAQHESAKAE
ncbi:MAG: hypothetical protein KC502_07890 [Myxococcales bacterium]|nr:hypothetical protein [Myxococcales bacterium]